MTTCLIIVDAFLKWLEIVPVKNATSSIIVDKVRGICSTNGLPDTILIVNDNAADFTTTEMEVFFIQWHQTDNIRFPTTQSAMALLRGLCKHSHLH